MTRHIEEPGVNKADSTCGEKNDTDNAAKK
jgi:hypothetical protein